MERLNDAIVQATAGELHRAAAFLEGAREIRQGKRGQRAKSRNESSASRTRKVDKPLAW